MFSFLILFNNKLLLTNIGSYSILEVSKMFEITWKVWLLNILYAVEEYERLKMVKERQEYAVQTASQRLPRMLYRLLNVLRIRM